jgi:hypothetical protein
MLIDMVKAERHQLDTGQPALMNRFRYRVGALI